MSEKRIHINNVEETNNQTILWLDIDGHQECFTLDGDLYTKVAARMFNSCPTEVTPDQYKAAKIAMYAAIYNTRPVA